MYPKVNPPRAYHVRTKTLISFSDPNISQWFARAIQNKTHDVCNGTIPPPATSERIATQLSQEEAIIVYKDQPPMTPIPFSSLADHKWRPIGMSIQMHSGPSISPIFSNHVEASIDDDDASDNSGVGAAAAILDVDSASSSSPLVSHFLLTTPPLGVPSHDAQQEFAREPLASSASSASSSCSSDACSVYSLAPLSTVPSPSSSLPLAECSTVFETAALLEDDKEASAARPAKKKRMGEIERLKQDCISQAAAAIIQDRACKITAEAESPYGAV